MKNQIASSIEQSRRLLSCGVDPETADMYWCFFLETEPFLCLGEIPVDNETGEMMNEGDIPAWSLSALCSLLPSKVTAPHANTPCYFRLYHMPDKWRAIYHDGKESGDAENYYWQCASEQDDTDPIEVCVMMIEWLSIGNVPLNKIEE